MNLEEEIIANFELPKELGRVIDILKPYQIMMNLAATKAFKAKGTGNKEELEKNLKLYKQFCEQAILQVLKD